MTIEELLEELHQLPASAATAHITFISKLRDETDTVKNFAFGVTRVSYDMAVVIIELALNPDARMGPGPESNMPSAEAVVLRREMQRAKRHLAKAKHEGKVIKLLPPKSPHA
jgi:hypothetical protein